MTHKVNTLISNPYGNVVTVTVIGCGGTGSILLATLARLNQALLRLRRVYMHVRVFDPDRISENNVTRQAFSPSDIGRFKSVVLAERINRFYNTTWIGFPYSWQDSLDTVRSNIIITCTDTASSRIELHPYLIEWSATTEHPRKLAYWIDTGNTATTANVVMGGYGAKEHQIASDVYSIPKDFIKGESSFDERIASEPVPRLPFVTELYDLKEHEKENPLASCSLAESLEHQHIMINDFTAKVAGMLLWDLFTLEYIDWRGAFINLANLNIKKLRI